MALAAPMTLFCNSTARRQIGHRGFLLNPRHLTLPRCAAWSDSSPIQVAILSAHTQDSSPASPLDFEYTTYAIKNASSARRPGRMDRSKLRPSRRGALERKSSKGFLAFERWTGNAAILEAEEAEAVAAASTSLAAQPSHAATRGSPHEPASTPSSPEHNQHLERALNQSNAMPGSPCWTGPSTPSSLLLTAAGAALSGPQWLHGAALTATMLCASASGPSISSSVPAAQRLSSSGHARSSAQQAQQRDVSTACANAQSPPLGPSRRASPPASSSGRSAAQQGGSNRGRQTSAPLPSRLSATRNPQQQKRMEGEEKGEEEEAGSSSSSCPSPSKWRLVGGSHALGINPRRAASDPTLKAALEAAEPRDVRRCVCALRRCLGGLPFKRVAAIVQREPRLIGKSEAELTMQTQELLAFMAFLPPPSKRNLGQQRREGSVEASGSLAPRRQQQPGSGSLAPRRQQQPGSGSGDSTSLRPQDLPRFLPEAVAMIESVPQLLSSPADYLRVVAALIKLLGGGNSDDDDGGGGSCDEKVLAAVAMMLHRRPQLLTLRQLRPHRGRDGVLPAASGGGGDLRAQRAGEQGSSLSDGVEGGISSALVHGGARCGYLEGFEGGLATLQTLLDLDRSRALLLVRKEPALLGLMPGALHAAAAALTSGPFQLEREALREVVEHSPDLLCTSPGVLKASCRRFFSLMDQSAAWGAFLPRLVVYPRNLAVALGFDNARLDRLDYLVSTRRDRGISYKQALTMPDDEFGEMYAGFKQWRAQIAQRGRGPPVG